jgi:flagellar hook-associated protein 2
MTATSSTSSTSSINATSSSSKRLSGLMSGLDTDTLVKELTAGTQAKIDKTMQDKQLAAWKQTSYRDVTSALQELQQKYFSSTTSSNSILSSSYFNTSSITNTSSFLNVSGNSTNAKNMMITGITQLARQASFSSSHKVSTEAITSSTTVKSEYTKSTLEGTSITINYGGTDYAITLDSDFSLNDPTDTNNLTKVKDALNAEIAANADLKDKVAFGVDSDGKIQLTTSDKNVYVKSGTSNLLSGLGLTADKTIIGTSSAPIQAGDAKISDFFNGTVASGSSLDLTIGSGSTAKTYTLELSSSVAIAAGSTDEIKASNAAALQTALQAAITSNPDLKNILKANVDDSGNVTLQTIGTAASEDLSVSGGSLNLVNGLGLTSSGATGTLTSAVNRDELVKTYLKDSLAGSTLTFSLDGVSKKITFDESKKDDYSTPAKLANYLQEKLNSAYGTGNVNVSTTAASGTDEDGTLSFQTKNTTSTFALTASDTTGILGSNGTLHIYAGETNRINTNKTLADLAGSLSTSLTTTDNGTYGITINGKDFTFKSTDTLATVISTINSDSDANVTISYSSTQDTFSIVADGGGKDSAVKITTLGNSNLATALFGTASSAPSTAAALTYDFTGQTKDSLDHKTITIAGITYEFTKDGKLTDSSHTGVDIGSTINAAGIASAFSTAAGLSGYRDTANGNLVTFTAIAAGSATAPTTDATGITAFTDGDETTNAALSYNFSGKSLSDLNGKTITLDGKTYEFTTASSLTNGNTAVTINAGSNGNDIAAAFRAAASLTGYDTSTGTITDGKVTFTAQTTGTKGSPVTTSDVAGTFTNGIDSDGDYTVTAGQNAIMTVSFDGNAADATTIERTENKFTLDDVNFELLKTTDSTVTQDTPITFSVKNETDDLYKKISDFVSDYNALLTLINGKVNESSKTDGTSYAPLTDAQKAEMTDDQITKWETNAKKGILQSDSILSTLSYNLRDAMSDTVSSIKSALYQIGIQEDDYDQYGKLTIDEDKLKDALSNNEDTVASLFTSSDGIAARLQTVINRNINTDIGADGTLIQKAGISTRTYDTSTIAQQITDYNKRIEDLKDQLETEQDLYYAKFTKLESYLSTMNAQSSLFTSSSSSDS